MIDLKKYFDESTIQQLVSYSDNKNCSFADRYDFQLIPKGSPVKTGVKFKPLKIIVKRSETGVNKTAMDDVKFLYAHAKTLKNCPHFIVDDNEIWQINPEDEVIVHSGSVSDNAKHTDSILITIAEYSGANQDTLASNVAELVAMLQVKYGISSENTFLKST